MDEEELVDEGERQASPPPALPGNSAAAIMLMLLEEADAAAVLKHFNPDEVRQLGRSMFDVASASEADIEIALDQFVLGSRGVSSLAVGANTRIRGMMTEALGNVRADNILSAIAPQSSAPSLELLRWMDTATIRRVMDAEHPQVGAIILAVLTPEAAAAALDGLDESRQADIVCRAARLSSIRGEAIEDLHAILTQVAAPKNEKPAVKLGGSAEVAKIVNKLPKPAAEKVLKSVKKRNKMLGQTIEDEMFVFDNLNDLDAKSLGTVLRAVDASSLAVALKGADPALVDKFLGTMSQRAAETIKDEMAEMTMVKRSEVEDAQKSIVVAARKLATEGSIALGSGGEDYV